MLCLLTIHSEILRIRFRVSSIISTLPLIPMASVSATSIRLRTSIKPASWGSQGKPETVAKVMDIVKKQLALSEDIALTPESTFAALGADSLDTVEIVMSLEEEFGITVEEDNSQTISTVQDAADLIDKVIGEKVGTAGEKVGTA